MKGAKSEATGLLPAQEAFAQAVAAGRSQADAYREAYPNSQQWKPESVHQQASRLANSRKVAARISVLRDEIERAAVERTAIDKADVIQELARIAFSDVSNLFDERCRLKPLHQLTDDERACIAAIESGRKIGAKGVTREFEKVKLWSKTDALERLARQLGLYRDGGPDGPNPFARLPRELRDRILALLDELQRTSEHEA
jgi:phage terminase small subunit